MALAAAGSRWASSIDTVFRPDEGCRYDPSKDYWFVRMRQGTGGADFAPELWSRGLVGVLYGTWRVEHVLGDDGRPDPGKVNTAHIQRVCPQPPFFQTGWTKEFRPFFLDLQVGDRVVISFDDCLHLGTIADGFLDDETPRGETQEYFKCRPVSDRKRFVLNLLPSVFRLIPTMRGTISRLSAFRPQAQLLDACADEAAVAGSWEHMGVQTFLRMLAPYQWELLCAEYLRDVEGIRPLLLKPGGCLPTVDLFGVDPKGARVVAQCKNDSTPWKASAVQKWLQDAALAPTDRVFFCCRGGVVGDLGDSRVAVLDGEAVGRWLERSPGYFGAIKRL